MTLWDDAADAAWRILDSLDPEPVGERAIGRQSGRQAWAAALLVGAGADPGRSRMELDDRLDYVWSKSIVTSQGNRGMPLAEGFDAFNDGTTTAANTVAWAPTTITAWAAFFESWKVLRRDDLLVKAQAFTDFYAEELWGFDNGSGFTAGWYGEHANEKIDQTYVVYNTAAMGLYAMAAMDNALGTSTYAAKRAAVSATIVGQRTVGVGNPDPGDGNPAGWRYRYGVAGADDQGHEHNTILALIEDGTVASLAAAEAAAEGHWTQYFLSTGEMLAWEPSGQANNPPGSLAVFSRLPSMHAQARLAAEQLVPEVEMDGDVSYIVGSDEDANWYKVNVAYGLAHFVRFTAPPAGRIYGLENGALVEIAA